MNRLIELKDIVSEEVGFDITKKTRKTRYVYARAIYYRLAREYTKESFENIANVVQRDHATALHGIRVFQTFLLQPKYFEYELEVYNKISKHYNDSDNFKETLIQRLQREKKEVIDVYKEINEQMNELKRKHNHMLKYFCRYEPNALEKYGV